MDTPITMPWIRTRAIGPIAIVLLFGGVSKFELDWFGLNDGALVFCRFRLSLTTNYVIRTLYVEL